MKRLVALLALVIAVFVSGCASLRRADGSLNIVAILTDAQFGLTEACSVQWVPPDACTIGQDAFTTAISIASKNLPGVRDAVIKSLRDSENLLPPDSRLRPYLDGALIILASA